MIRFLLLCCITCMLSAQELHVTLHEHVTVDKEAALLGDMATITGNDEQVKQAQALIVRRVFDLATRTVQAPEVRHLLMRHFRGIRVSVVGTTELRRASQHFSAADIVQHAKEHLQQRAEDRQIDIAAIRDPLPITVPQDSEATLNLVAEPLTTNWWGEVPYRVRLVRQGVELGRSLVVFKLVTWREVPVANREIPRGHTLSLQDITIERIQVGPRQAKHHLSIEDCLGWVAIRDIPHGTPLSQAWAKPLPDIVSGQVVVLVYQSNSFRLTTHAEALASGHVGDLVRVRVSGGNSVVGKIIGPNEVQLQR